jgi:hypothetical protein
MVDTSKQISSSMIYATKLHPLKLLTISARAEYVPTEEHTTPTIIIPVQSPACRHEMNVASRHTLIHKSYDKACEGCISQSVVPVIA